MSKVYVVVETGYEYDDSIYSLSSPGNGNPIRVFADRNLAKMFCETSNIKELRKISLRDYCYNIADLDKSGHLKKYLKANNLSEDSNLSNVDEGILKKILQHSFLEFYSVVEVSDEIPTELIKLAVESK